VIHFIKTQAFNIPVALLTNGTLLFQKRVRDNIKDASEGRNIGLKFDKKG
jgi:hypothetical protein